MADWKAKRSGAKDDRDRISDTELDASALQWIDRMDGISRESTGGSRKQRGAER
jgi:hypothetical protein